MKFIVFLISAFAFEQLSKDLKNSIATEFEPFSAMKMISLSPKLRKIKIHENLKVSRDFYPFELFRFAATGKYCFCDENGRLNENFDLQRVNEYGENFVHFAAQNDHREVVKALAEHGAELNKADNYGYTPVYAAACRGNTEVVKVLAEHGADLNKANISGWTPTHRAAANGQTEVVKVLAEHGADLNKADNDGWTPVYKAARKGRTEVVKILIESNVKLNKNLLEIAETKEIKQIIQNELKK